MLLIFKIALRISEDQKQIQLGFKKPFTLVGDIDILLKLKMHKLYPKTEGAQFQ